MPAAPDATTQGTNRDERTTELYLRDAITLTDRLTTWIGLRHSRLDRQSVSTDGTAATAYRQSFTTPWVAAGFALTPDQLLYASWGKGVESEVAPNLPRYTNAGQPLPALKSRQVELGLKGASDMLSWGVAAFDIVRPLFVDVGTCDVDAVARTCATAKRAIAVSKRRPRCRRGRGRWTAGRSGCGRVSRIARTLR